MTGRRRRGVLWFVAGGALTLLVGRWVAGHYAEWAFFRALGLGEIWRSRILHTTALASGAFVAATGFAFANLYAVRRSIVSLVLPRQLSNIEFGEAVPSRRLTLLAAIGALGFGLVFAMLPHDWPTAAMAWEGVAFREFEPYLERDLGFFATWLPWELGLLHRTTLAVTVVTLVVILLYASTPSVKWGAEGLYVSTWVRRHLVLLAGVIVLLVGWDWRLDRYERLVDGSGIWGDRGWDAAFSAFDHHVALPYLAVVSFATIPIAAVLAWAGWNGLHRPAFALVTALLLLGPVAGALLPLALRDPPATPEARGRERPYLNTSALFTRRAFAVEEVATTDAVARARLTAAALDRHVSIWDPAALARSVSLARTTAAEVSVAWQGGEVELEAITIRAPPERGRPAEPWEAERLTASQMDVQAAPVPVVGAVPQAIGGVHVAPGLRSYAVVADSSGRTVAPRFASPFERLAQSWALQDPGLFLRELPSPDPRLFTHRDVHARLRRVAPFFTPGPTVTPLVRGDSLHWLVELFVTSSHYPLSERLDVLGDRLHYARHAATAIVQAQSGAVLLVATERPDAITRTWMRRFPTLIRPLEDAPAWYRATRPPALDVTLVQAAALSRVGFARDTLGRRSVTRADDADPDVTAAGPALFRVDTLGGLGWGVPMDIPQDGRMIGVLVARGGSERRTEYHDAPPALWTGVLGEIRHAADAAGITRGVSNLRRGRVQAVPTDAGPAFVQSFYEWPADAAPRHLGVVILLDGRARAGRTLGEALGHRAPRATVLPDHIFRARVNALYDAMQAALRAGDWTAYGRAWDALGRLLNRRSP
ncbi:MAG: UPF0182 family protein [Gemmatimonadaceae bacterium]